jgi:hypothetical protein
MKFNCKDPLVQLLKEYGYNLVLLPKDSIKPLHLLVREERGLLTWVKDIFITPELNQTNALLDEIFIPDSQAYPIPQPATAPSDFFTGRSADVDVEASIELMLNFLDVPKEKVTADEKLKIKAAFQSINHFSFAFDQSASIESVSTVILDGFLRDAVVRGTVGNTFLDWLDHSQIYIVTEVIKGNSFSMKSKEDDKATLEAALPKIKEILAGKFKGHLELANQTTIKHKGDKQLVFGLKAVKLLAEKEKGQYRFKIRNQEGLAVKGDEDFPVEVLGVDGNFVEL